MTDINQKTLEEKINSLQKETSSTVPEFIPVEKPKKDIKKIILTFLGLTSFLILGIGGVLIAQKQSIDDSVTAPNAPKSEPAAYINKASCHLSFTVPEIVTPTPELVACGVESCSEENPCADGLTCITTDDELSYCSQPEYEDACAANPSEEACCTEPTPTPAPGECGATPCTEDTDCNNDLVCITADDDESYCSKPEYEDACIVEPGVEACCTEPNLTPTTPAATPTQASGGGSSSSSSSSSSNSSVVVNIENTTTNSDGTLKKTTATTTPKTTTKEGTQPEYPEELPKSGPEDWIQYLQIGLGTLGVGVLLILFL